MVCPEEDFRTFSVQLHLCEIEEDEENEREKASGQQYDPLLKVKPFMNKLWEACQQAHHVYYPV